MKKKINSLLILITLIALIPGAQAAWDLNNLPTTINMVAGSTHTFNYDFKSTDDPFQAAVTITESSNLKDWDVTFVLNSTPINRTETFAGHFETEIISLDLHGSNSLIINITPKPYLKPTPYKIVFVIAGVIKEVTVDTGSGGSSGSSGGGGVTTNEPYSNIALYDRAEKNLVSGKPVSFRFKNVDIYEVLLNGKENENDVVVKVEVLKERSTRTPIQPDYDVYKYINIYAGTQRINEAIIRFKVEAGWTNGRSISLIRWNGKAWEELPTSALSRDENYAYYEARGSSLSNFAIVGKTTSAIGEPVATVPTPQAVEVATIETVTPDATETPESPGFALIAAIFGLVVVYAYVRYRQ